MEDFNGLKIIRASGVNPPLTPALTPPMGEGEDARLASHEANLFSVHREAVRQRPGVRAEDAVHRVGSVRGTGGNRKARE